MINDKFSSRINEISHRLTKISEETCSCTLNTVSLRSNVANFIHHVRTAMYPGIYSELGSSESFSESFVSENLSAAADILYDMLLNVMGGEGGASAAEDVTAKFFESLPDIAAVIKTDVMAAYDGDPAAKCYEEIMLSYPSFEAVGIYRLAHPLYKLNVPLIPRMMTEQAHQKTGIDIHPGAEIGPYFFIDHGTGVVIGETCVIGEHVKLYQGVTLGARSFKADENGNPIKGIKRHPNIGNNVVIYAGAAILGGDTYVGDNSVIGGNVWLTHSVEPGSILYYDGEVKTRNADDKQ